MAAISWLSDYVFYKLEYWDIKYSAMYQGYTTFNDRIASVRL